MVAHRAGGQVQVAGQVGHGAAVRAARSASVSLADSGVVPAVRVSAASTGSTTRSPPCTRRTASASCRAGAAGLHDRGDQAVRDGGPRG
ncbi:hypothetical protein [Klenkia terrae]